MTRLLNSKGKGIPVIIDTIGEIGIYIELRIYNEEGARTGSVHNFIDREDAKTLAKNLNKWLKDTEGEING